jgi:hypothetical protein
MLDAEDADLAARTEVASTSTGSRATIATLAAIETAIGSLATLAAIETAIGSLATLAAIETALCGWRPTWGCRVVSPLLHWEKLLTFGFAGPTSEDVVDRHVTHVSDGNGECTRVSGISTG